jgi:hypothetical protein
MPCILGIIRIVTLVNHLIVDLLCRPCSCILLPSVILSKLQHSPTGSSREGVKGESFTEKPLDAANNDAETAVC